MADIGLPKAVGAAKPEQAVHPIVEARAKLGRAEELRRSGALDKAQRICEELIAKHPDYVGALYTLGLILADKRDYRRAMSFLAQAVMLNPKDWMSLTALSGVYLRLGARVMATRTLEEALQRKPDDAGILVTLGEIYREEREYELGAGAYRRAGEIEPSLVSAGVGLGLCLTHLGQPAEAATAFQRVIAQQPQPEGENLATQALYSLCQLPPAFVSLDALSLLERATPSRKQTKEDFESSVAFARAAALDKAGRHREAWENLLAANRWPCRQAEADYRKDVTARQTVLSRAAKSPAMSRREDLYQDAPLSLFILGPSRSGKTTMERLVGMLDGVKRGYENPILENSARRTFQTAGLLTRSQAIELPPELDELYRGFYFEELKERAGSAKVFTNTHPGRIVEAYRVAGALRRTRFIFIKRDIEDIVLRIFMKRYSGGNSYAYSVETIREYVSWYYAMIDRLAVLLPGISLVIRYEDMIADPRAALGQAAELCGLIAGDMDIRALGDDRHCAEPYRDFLAASTAEAPARQA